MCSAGLVAVGKGGEVIKRLYLSIYHLVEAVELVAYFCYKFIVGQ